MAICAKRKRIELSLDTKIKLIEDIEGGMTRKQAQEQYQLGKSTIHDILSAKVELRKKKMDNVGAKFRVIKSKFSEINHLMLLWFKMARDKNIPVSGHMLRAKANPFAEELNIENFQASEGWLSKWKQRNGIQQFKACGERGDVSDEAVTEWKEKIEEICMGYDMKNVFNCDETALFYKALPGATLAMKSEDVVGSQKTQSIAD